MKDEKYNESIWGIKGRFGRFLDTVTGVMAGIYILFTICWFIGLAIYIGYWLGA